MHVGAKARAEVKELTRRNADMTVTMAGLIRQNAETAARMRVSTKQKSDNAEPSSG